MLPRQLRGHCGVLLALGALALALAGCGAGCIAERGRLASIGLTQGYGHLRNVDVSADGSVFLSGFEPGRMMASQWKAKLPPERLAEAWRLVGKIDLERLGSGISRTRMKPQIVFRFKDPPGVVFIPIGRGADPPPEVGALVEELRRIMDEARRIR